MKRTFKTLALACVVVGAMVAVSAASASAATKFKASSTGTLKGAATTTQVFNTGAGKVECSTAASSGTVTTPLEKTTQEITVNYSGCRAFTFVGVNISTAHYLFNANGEVTILSPITIEVPAAGCSVNVPAQTVKSVSYVNKSGKIEEVTNVSGIKSTGTGGACGGANTTGTYTGNNLIELVGGTIEAI